MYLDDAVQRCAVALLTAGRLMIAWPHTSSLLVFGLPLLIKQELNLQHCTTLVLRCSGWGKRTMAHPKLQIIKLFGILKVLLEKFIL